MNRIKQNKLGIILFILILLLWGTYQQYISTSSSLEQIETIPVSSEESTNSIPTLQWSVADLFYQTTAINQVRPADSLLHLERSRCVQTCGELYNATPSGIYQICLLFIWIFILSLPLLCILEIICYIHHQDGYNSLNRRLFFLVGRQSWKR